MHQVPLVLRSPPQCLRFRAEGGLGGDSWFPNPSLAFPTSPTRLLCGWELEVLPGQVCFPRVIGWALEFTRCMALKWKAHPGLMFGGNIGILPFLPSAVPILLFLCLGTAGPCTQGSALL